VKEIVNGVATTRGSRVCVPEADKTLPPEFPIRKKSQHPSVANDTNVSKLYPVGLFIVYLQLRLFEYEPPLLLSRTIPDASTVDDPDGQRRIHSAMLSSPM
jgi:hypothetical protein